jgi:hypothetical protein
MRAVAATRRGTDPHARTSDITPSTLPRSCRYARADLCLVPHILTYLRYYAEYFAEELQAVEHLTRASYASMPEP